VTAESLRAGSENMPNFVTRQQLSCAAYASVKKGRSAGQALWPAAKAFGQKTHRPAV